MPQRPEPSERPLTPKQVADIFSVSVTTVAKWAEDGKLPHFKTPGGQRRFVRAEVEELRRRLSGGGEAVA